MSTYVYESKLVNESLDVTASFLSRMVVGETLGTCAASMSVSSGTDPAPEDMLSGACVVSGSNVVQKLKGGLPGVIYILSLSGRSTLNNVFVQEVKIAVLTSQAVPPPP